MATKIVRSNNDQPEKTVKKAAEEAKQTAAKAEKAEKPQQTVKPAAPVKGSSAGYRIGAIVLWVLALACEVCCILILTGALYVPNKLLFLIIGIVLDMALAIIAAQLWKKANRIKPMSKKNKFLFYLWNELGVIMAAICFIPLIILLLKDKDLDKRSKLIVTIVAVMAMLITGAASADYDPISAEEKDAAESDITDDVYWSTFGRKYHVDLDCQAIANSATVYQGTVTEAIESGRSSLCSFCAHRHPELDTGELKIEEAAAEVADLTAAPAN